MATGTTPLPVRDPIAGLNSILDLYSGKQTTSTTAPETTTRTTKSNLTPEQLQAQINEAMAPLNAASHGNGLSTYSDTSLALGRSEIAANTLAKYAGSTETTQSSGRTTTQTTPGPLSGGRLGDTLSGLAVTQIGAPLLKKLGESSAMQGLQDSISGASSSMLDSILSPSAMESVGRVNSSGATDTISSGIDALTGSDLSSAITQQAVSSGAGDVLSGLGDSISSGAGNVIDWFKSLFAEGGPVNTSSGYIDRPAASSNLTRQSDTNSVIQSINSAAGTIGETANNNLVAYVTGAGGGSNSKKSNEVDPTTGAALPFGVSDNISALAGPNIGMANTAMSAATAINPIIGTLVSKLIDVPTVQAQLADYVSQVAGVVKDGGPQNFSHGTGEVGTKDPSGFGTMGGGGDSEGGVRSASGGHIRGPGTGTSDSIDAKLSDGEYVIDAKTVQALGPEFFQKIQAMFNPEALASQAAKGRI